MEGFQIRHSLSSSHGGQILLLCGKNIFPFSRSHHSSSSIKDLRMKCKGFCSISSLDCLSVSSDDEILNFPSFQQHAHPLCHGFLIRQGFYSQILFLPDGLLRFGKIQKSLGRHPLFRSEKHIPLTRSNRSLEYHS